MSRQFVVIGQALQLGYGSHTRNLTPSSYKRHDPGAVLTLHVEAPDGTVWFFDDAGDRGKIDCGSVRNLLDEKRIKEISA